MRCSIRAIITVLLLSVTTANAQTSEPTAVDDKTISDMLYKMSEGQAALLVDQCSAKWPNLRANIRSSYAAHLRMLDTVIEKLLQSPKGDEYRKMPRAMVARMEALVSEEAEKTAADSEQASTEESCAAISTGFRVTDEKALSEILARILASYERRMPSRTVGELQ